MQDKLWSQEDADLLHTLMMNRGMEAPQLARISAMSIQQVLELAFGLLDGETSRFYSPQIKQYSGQKLLTRLQALEDKGGQPS